MAIAIQATPRTINAIRKADKLPRDMRIGNNNRRGVPMTSRKVKPVSYNGYFAVTISEDKTNDDDDTKLLVRDGRYQINLLTGTTEEKEFNVSSDGLFYLEVDLDDNTGEVKFDSSPPESDYDKFVCVVGEVSFDGDAISEIRQHQYGEVKGIIFGDTIDGCN